MYKYTPISVSDSSGRDSFIDRVQEKQFIATKKLWSSKHTFGTLFVLSLLANIALVVFQVASKYNAVTFERSKYAGLTRTVAKTWTLLYPDNETAVNELWDQHTSYDTGVLALQDNYAKAMGLPRGQRWPWDSNRGIYLLNAYHNLHCVKEMHTAFEEFRSNRPQTKSWAHLQHCLLVLREEIMCNADDTPRYSGYQPPHASGTGQVRMCRDWNALEAWAKSEERTACWRDIPEKELINQNTTLDQYRFCPEGSPYKEIAETSWLHLDD